MSSETKSLLVRIADARDPSGSSPDREILCVLVAEAVREGIYPESTPYLQQGHTHLQMVENWGAEWHIWEEPHFCPLCDTDLRNHESGPPFLRILSTSLGSGVRRFCPDCRGVITLPGEDHGVS